MRIGITSLGMGSQPLDEVLRFAASIGCEALELNGRETVHAGLWAPPIDYESIRRRLSATGLHATSLGGYSDFAQPSDEALAEQVNTFLGYCDVARTMRIPVVRAFVGDAAEGRDLDALYPRIVEGFRAVMERVVDWGILVGIENHGRLANDGDVLHSIVRDVGSPLLGITLDTGNFCWAGHSIDAAHRFFGDLAPLTVSVHVKDGRFVDGAFEFLPAGRGDIDIKGLYDTLFGLGYPGAVVSEYEGALDYATGTLESVAYLRGLRDGVGWREGEGDAE